MLIAAFAVILVTVVVQGSSLGWLIRRVRPEDTDPLAAMDLAAAEAAIAHAKRAVVEVRAYDSDGTLIHPQLLAQYRKRDEVTQRYAKDTEMFLPDFRAHLDVVLAAIASGRAALIDLHRKGMIEDEVLHDLERDLDHEEMAARYQRYATGRPTVRVRARIAGPLRGLF
jgi:monovalent cation/hydrogen antiporter